MTLHWGPPLESTALVKSKGPSALDWGPAEMGSVSVTALLPWENQFPFCPHFPSATCRRWHQSPLRKGQNSLWMKVFSGQANYCYCIAYLYRKPETNRGDQQLCLDLDWLPAALGYTVVSAFTEWAGTRETLLRKFLHNHSSVLP